MDKHKTRKVIEEMVGDNLKKMQDFVREILSEKAVEKLEEKKQEIAATFIKRN